MIARRLAVSDFPTAPGTLGPEEPDWERSTTDRAPRPQEAALVDLGSGGGLPGLVVACSWEEATVTLIDSSARRAAFLELAADRLDLHDRVSVVNARAEACGRDERLRGSFDGVTARSFGRPAVVAECAAPLLKVGGWLLVSEPPPSSEGGPPSVRWPEAPLDQLGLVPREEIHEEFGYQVLRQVELCGERYPRRVGVPAKKPLF